MSRILFLILLFASLTLANKDLESGDYWFKNRAQNSKYDHADPSVVAKMVNAYKRALQDSSVQEKAAERLLYAYYYQGCYALKDHEKRLKLFAESKKLGEEMHEKYPKNKVIASLYAQNLSLWSREYGALQAVKEGAAKKVRDLSTEAENWQFLGRAHQLLPYIPLLLSWPDKELAEKYLLMAYKQDPKDLNTRLFIAELRFDQKRYEEALNWVNEALDRGVRTDYLVEDKRTRWKLKDLREKIKKKIE